MKKIWRYNYRGIALVEVLVATAVFLLFSLGVYGSINLVFKIVYSSRLRILETAILSEKLEIARNLPFEDVGIVNGIPSGVLPYTTTTIRNGITFNIITTVRNVDDPFDGMATGTVPIDTAPADYKLVEMSIICNNCNQTNPVILNTRVSPKNLEGASDNGSLFIHVFDSTGKDIQGVSVNVINVSSSLNLTDVTDNDGMLRIVDIPTGTEAYDVSITKSGYTSDGTIRSTVDNPNPNTSPANIVSQKVTEMSFEIDLSADLTVNTINQYCSALGIATFNMRGDKTIGHDPTVYKINDDYTTNAYGIYNFDNWQYDKYYLSVSGTVYDLAGTIPITPWNITPGLTQEAYLILYPHSANSLLVGVIDAGTKGPVSSSTVQLSKGDYDQTITTGVGYTIQSDWSGGSGQVDYTDSSRYFADNSNIENNSPAGDIKLKNIGGYYYNGWLESSTFDMGSNPTYRNITWSPQSQPENTNVKFQLASSNSSTPATWEFVGPDGTNGSYYTTTSSLVYSGHNSNRYLRYKAFLNTDITTSTPAISDMTLTYTNGCIPPGQAFFTGLTNGLGYSLSVSHNSYDTSQTTVNINGNENIIVELSPL